jgi:hypothetical protein
MRAVARARLGHSSACADHGHGIGAQYIEAALAHVRIAAVEKHGPVPVGKRLEQTGAVFVVRQFSQERSLHLQQSRQHARAR